MVCLLGHAHPSQLCDVMPKLITPDSAIAGALNTENSENCRNYRLIGLECGMAAGFDPQGLVFSYASGGRDPDADPPQPHHGPLLRAWQPERWAQCWGISGTVGAAR